MTAPAGTGETHLTIDAVFDSSVTELQASDPTLYAAYTGAIDTAVRYYESLIVNPITITINFGWGEEDGRAIVGGVGQSRPSAVEPVPYAELYAAVAADFTTSAVQAAALASLPASDPTDGAGAFYVTPAQAAALGLDLGAAPATAGYVGLDSSLSYAFAQSGVAGSGSNDAVAVLEHEISEVMGRVDYGGLVSYPGAPANYSLLDMFRYTASAAGVAGGRDQPFAAGYSAGADSYFSYNGRTVTLEYDTPTEVAGGDDIGDWSNAVRGDAYDGEAIPGVVEAISTADLDELNVLGYDLAGSGAAACYVRGTRIATPSGERAIESLAIGEFVLTPSGNARPIVWLGHRRIDCRRHPKPCDAWPVRVRRGAFGAGLPHRDLFLSPDHAVFVDGVLIPVRYLVNGATIVQEPAASITYWHLELARHDVVLAEGLPCETYLDTGNRGAFANAGAAVPARPDLARRIWDTASCAPLVLGGPRLVAAKRHRLTQAASLGFATSDDPALRVLADGRELPAQRAGRRWHVRPPPSAKNLRLISRSWIPAQTRADQDDARRLGVAVARIWLDGRAASLESPGLVSGWHAPEPRWRWTDGDAVLALSGTREVTFDIAMTGTYWRTGRRQRRRAA